MSNSKNPITYHGDIFNEDRFEILTDTSQAYIEA